MSEKSFGYKALNDKGKMKRGSVDASSKESATRKVVSLGLTPVEIEERSLTGLNREINLGPNRVKVKDLALSVKQLAAMTEAGLPLVLSIETAAEQTDNKGLRKSLEKVAKDIRDGDSFSEALERQGEYYPPLMINMIKVGEVGGFLDVSLNGLAQNFEDEVELRGKIKSAMSYPIVVAVLAVVGVAIMLLFVVPMFEEMFAGMGHELPLPTRIMIALGEGAPVFVPIAIIVIVLSVVFWKQINKIKAIRRVVDPFKLKIPIFGKVYHKILVARFAKNLSTMISAGVPLLTALDVAADTSGNVVLEDAILNVSDEVRMGKSMERPMRSEEVFPRMMTQMVAVGEESGNLEEMFSNVSEFYDREVREATESLTSLIEPLLIVLVGVLIGGMVISLYLPMFSMYSHLQDG